MSQHFLSPANVKFTSPRSIQHQRKRSRYLNNTAQLSASIGDVEVDMDSTLNSMKKPYQCTHQRVVSSPSPTQTSRPSTPLSATSKYKTTSIVTPSKLGSGIKSVFYEIECNDDFIFDCPMVCDFQNGENNLTNNESGSVVSGYLFVV
jgi:hypothetical protein